MQVADFCTDDGRVSGTSETSDSDTSDTSSPTVRNVLFPLIGEQDAGHRTNRTPDEARERLQGSFVHGPAPCNDCESAKRCAVARLACMDFARWVDTGRDPLGARIATRAVYRRLYSAEDTAEAA